MKMKRERKGGNLEEILCSDILPCEGVGLLGLISHTSTEDNVW